MFGENAETYAKVRPYYPREIYQYLHSICINHDEAWDTACGNGQAAVGLSEFFKQVHASDISEEQIVHARQHPKVSYTVQAAETTNFEDNQFDLVCAAQALHWFDDDLFWDEVKRVLKPSGIFAAWGYSWFSIEKKIDACMQEKILGVIKPYWAEENKLLWDGYRDIDMPLMRIESPTIEMEMRWDLRQLFDYLGSWSAIRRCRKVQGDDFLAQAYESIRTEWGDGGIKKKVSMDFTMVIGRNEKH